MSQKLVLMVVVDLLGFVFVSSVHAQIVINEIMPNPADEANEWIELYNQGGESVDISNWLLDDEPNAGSKPFSLPSGSSITGNGYLVFYKSVTHLSLNNAKQKDVDFADQVRLINTKNEVVDQFTYQSTVTDKSLGRSPNGSGEFVFQDSPSPQAANLTQTPTSTVIPPTPTQLPPTTLPSPKPTPIPISTPTPVISPLSTPPDSLPPPSSQSTPTTSEKIKPPVDQPPTSSTRAPLVVLGAMGGASWLLAGWRILKRYVF